MKEPLPPKDINIFLQPYKEKRKIMLKRPSSRKEKRMDSCQLLIHMHLQNKGTLTWHDKKLSHLIEIRRDQSPLLLHAANTLRSRRGTTVPTVFLLIQQTQHFCLHREAFTPSFSSHATSGLILLTFLNA